MASELSREEMEYVIGQAKETASDWVIEHLNKVSDTDAALRQQLEAARQGLSDEQDERLEKEAKWLAGWSAINARMLSIESERDQLRQQLIEAERQRDVHADLACEWRRELGALRQQLEQSQQLVTDGQEAIGHWQGEVYHVRQLLVDEKAIADHNLTDWHEAEHKIEQLRQRVRELEQEIEVGVQLTGSFFEALKPLKLTAIYVENPGRHITDLITQLAAAQARIQELETK